MTVFLIPNPAVKPLAVVMPRFLLLATTTQHRGSIHRFFSFFFVIVYSSFVNNLVLLLIRGDSTVRGINPENALFVLPQESRIRYRTGCHAASRRGHERAYERTQVHFRVNCIARPRNGGGALIPQVVSVCALNHLLYVVGRVCMMMSANIKNTAFLVVSVLHCIYRGAYWW